MHRSEFHYAQSHVNADNEVTLHRSEILPQCEISNRFEFTFGSHVNVLLEGSPKHPVSKAFCVHKQTWQQM